MTPAALLAALAFGRAPVPAAASAFSLAAPLQPQWGNFLPHEPESVVRGTGRNFHAPCDVPGSKPQILGSIKSASRS